MGDFLSRLGRLPGQEGLRGGLFGASRGRRGLLVYILNRDPRQRSSGGGDAALSARRRDVKTRPFSPL